MAETYVYLLKDTRGGESLLFVDSSEGWKHADKTVKDRYGNTHAHRVGTLDKAQLIDLAVKAILE